MLITKVMDTGTTGIINKSLLSAINKNQASINYIINQPLKLIVAAW